MASKHTRSWIAAAVLGALGMLASGCAGTPPPPESIAGGDIEPI